MAEDILKEVQDGIVDLFKEDKPKIHDRPYVNVEKAATLQAARDFHDSIKVKEKPTDCVVTITKLLHLQNNTDQRLQTVEATEIFFGITKLFVSSNAPLRRMVYVILKDIYSLCDPSDVIIVTSCLTKDMTCQNDVYRANSLRVLVRIIDSAMLSAIERYVKQAIIDKSHLVSSSAIVSSMHLFQASSENASIVKRWIGEVQEAIKSPNEMVQFHATQLFYLIKASDRLAVSKFVQKYTRGVSNSSSPPSGSRNVPRLTSPLAIVCLIRYTAKLLHEEVIEGRAAPDNSIMDATELCSIGYNFLISCLRHESEMVAFEAAKSICMLPTQSPEVVFPALSVLQLSLSSQRPSSRLATVKLLSGLAIVHPNLVARFNAGLEALIGDSNRLIGTLSIMTLLKTGSEASMDRLLKSIATFLHHIAEEYKIMVVNSLERLCLTYPSKFRIVVGFMSKFLRDEGGFEFKWNIVSTIESLMEQIPETRETSLIYLCEFIEDCEFVGLSTHILHLIGDNGPKTSCPSRYVRYIYNRCILENAMIRAAAISALLKFGAHCPQLRLSILSLIRTCTKDENDEARDRAMLAVDMLEEAEKQKPFVQSTDESEIVTTNTDDDIATNCLAKIPFSFNNLAQRLKAYEAIPGAMGNEETLSFDILPMVEERVELDIATSTTHLEQEITRAQSHDANLVLSAAFKSPQMHDPAAVLYAIPELASLGRVFRSTSSTALTETETEYVVHCLKHIYNDHVVLQFNVQNTIDDQRLENVSVAIEADTEVFECTGELPCEAIAYGETASCFAILERQEQEALSLTTFSCELKFSVVQVDRITGEAEGEPFEEEYPLENLEIFVSDFMAKTAISDFRSVWESIGNDNEILCKFALNEKSISSAASAVIECIGMQTCDGTAKVNPASKQHMLHLSGIFLGDFKVVARCQLARSSGAIILKMAIRSPRKDVSQLVADCIG